MFDMALLNAHILHQKINKTKKTKYTSFRLNVTEELLKKVSLPNYNLCGCPSHSDAPLRLQAKNRCHFPEHIPPTANKQHPTKRCHVCAKHNIRSETSLQCKRCQIALHLPECFEKYHTLETY